MIRAVLDVNVLASAFPQPKGPSGVIVQAGIRGDFVVVVSETMLERLAVAWRKPYFLA